jgi:ParB family chromosome partitioning protein
MANVKNKPVRRSAFADLGGAGGAAQFFPGQNPAGVEDLESARSISIDLLEANPYQPRKTFDDAALVELAADIEEHGVLQPLLVRPHPQECGRYQIAAGERRWRAARLAGLAQVPCIERDMDDGAMERLALVENIQRADLDPVDEAHVLDGR